MMLFDPAIDGAVLLDDVVRFVRRFVVMSPAQRDAVALWVLHTHAIEAADRTPYLTALSALKRSGKSRLLEVLKLLVREPLPTANISDAALFRAIEEKKPTLLLDEIDAIFGPKARDREDLRGMLNAGFERGGVTHRMGGPRMSTLETFSVFCAKVFAGIGQLPDTIGDRAILIRLERKTRDEPVERFRRRDIEPEGHALRDRLADWAEPQLEELRAARPDLPDELDDRAQDIWEPLLAVADLAGVGWPARARNAAVELSGNGEREDETHTVRLLADIRDVFEATGKTRYKTADLIAELCKIEESPWGEWFGKSLTSYALSRLLKPFRIQTKPLWIDRETVRGYQLEQFENAFARVLPVRSVRAVRDGLAPDEAPNAPNVPNAYPTGGNGRIEIPGDPDFADWIDQKLHDGHLAETEWLERRKLHEFVRVAGDVDEDIPLS
jgi:hypothetical protein